VLVGVADCLGAAAGADLGEQVVDVAFHCAPADDEHAVAAGIGSR
jgi:hypothetical protein